MMMGGGELMTANGIDKRCCHFVRVLLIVAPSAAQQSHQKKGGRHGERGDKLKSSWGGMKR